MCLMSELRCLQYLAMRASRTNTSDDKVPGRIQQQVNTAMELRTRAECVHRARDRKLPTAIREAARPERASQAADTTLDQCPKAETVAATILTLQTSQSSCRPHPNPQKGSVIRCRCCLCYFSDEVFDSLWRLCGWVGEEEGTGCCFFWDSSLHQTADATRLSPCVMRAPKWSPSLRVLPLVSFPSSIYGTLDVATAWPIPSDGQKEGESETFKVYLADPPPRTEQTMFILLPPFTFLQVNDTETR